MLLSQRQLNRITHPERWRERPCEASATGSGIRTLCQFRQPVCWRWANAVWEMTCANRLSCDGEFLYFYSMRTVFWENSHVKMIDQRKLPHELVVNEYDDYS